MALRFHGAVQHQPLYLQLSIRKPRLLYSKGLSDNDYGTTLFYHRQNGSTHIDLREYLRL